LVLFCAQKTPLVQAVYPSFIFGKKTHLLCFVAPSANLTIEH
jgi:hypothetical protein